LHNYIGLVSLMLVCFAVGMQSNPEAQYGSEHSPEHIAKFIKGERESQGISQRKLAQLAGVDVKTLRSIEAGERNTYGTSLYKVETALRQHSHTIPPDIGPIRSARDLTDEELAAELTYRLLRNSR
jgi:DNA-binding XRE family transcriptional regulator